jgi:hypothetical protein
MVIVWVVVGVVRGKRGWFEMKRVILMRMMVVMVRVTMRIVSRMSPEHTVYALLQVAVLAGADPASRRSTEAHLFL